MQSKSVIHPARRDLLSKLSPAVQSQSQSLDPARWPPLPLPLFLPAMDGRFLRNPDSPMGPLAWLFLAARITAFRSLCRVRADGRCCSVARPVSALRLLSARQLSDTSCKQALRLARIPRRASTPTSHRAKVSIWRFNLHRCGQQNRNPPALLRMRLAVMASARGAVGAVVVVRPPASGPLAAHSQDAASRAFAHRLEPTCLTRTRPP